MTKTNRERVLEYLRRIAPQGAMNREIGDATDVKPHQQVYKITQALMAQGLIKGVRREGIWCWYAASGPAVDAMMPGPPVEAAGVEGITTWSQGGALSPKLFEKLARSVMSEFMGRGLVEREVAAVGKRFDMVSDDGMLVGDAKYLTMVGGKNPPPAKLSVIAEHVWLLEKCEAREQFLVFGNDRRAPELWLRKYGHLVDAVRFFFLDDDGNLEEMNCGVGV